MTWPKAWVPRWGVVWCVLFAAAHVFRALGGRTGFVAATGSADLLEQGWFVVLGLWGVALALLVGGAACPAAVAGWGRGCRCGRCVRCCGPAGVLPALRAVRTGAQDVLLEAGALRPNPGFDWSVVHWRLALWTPWSCVGAVLFPATAARHHRPARRTSVAG